MTVTTNYRPSTNTGDTPVTKALPPNGVIYVKTGSGCGTLIPPANATYTEPASCGNLYVSGTYTLEHDARGPERHHRQAGHHDRHQREPHQGLAAAITCSA